MENYLEFINFSHFDVMFDEASKTFLQFEVS